MCGVNHAGAAATGTARAPSRWSSRLALGTNAHITSNHSTTITWYVLVAVITVQHADTVQFVLVFFLSSFAGSTVSVSLILVRQNFDTAQQYRHHSPNTQARYNNIFWILYTMQQPA